MASYGREPIFIGAGQGVLASVTELVAKRKSMLEVS